MSLTWQGGALVLTAADGHQVFNSNWGHFSATDYVSDATYGTVSLPSKSAVTQGPFITSTVNDTDDFDVAPVSAVATHIVGVCSVTRSSADAGSATMWIDVSGTTIVGLQPLDNVDYRATPTYAGLQYYRYLGTIHTITFYLSGGRLKLRRRLIIRASTTFDGVNRTLTEPAASVRYRVLAGFFS